MATKTVNSISSLSWTGIPLFVFTLLVIIPALAQAAMMSDHELDSVTAGAAVPANETSSQSTGTYIENPPTVVIGAGSSGSGGAEPGTPYTASSSKSHDDGPDDTLPPAPGYYGYSVVGGQSTYSLASEASVSLSDSTQAGARALNLVNVSSGDSSTGINLWTKGTVGGIDAREGFVLRQTNSIDQNSAQSARLSGWVSAPSLSYTTSESASANASTQTFVTDSEKLHTVSGRTVTTTANVSVENPSITIPDTLTPEPLTFGFEVKKTIRVPDPKVLPGDNATDFTFNFSVTGAELTLPTVDLTGPSITADRAVVRLPDINLGSVSVRRGVPESDGTCSAIKGCIRRSFDLGTLKGREITLNGPIEILKNPFYNAELDIPVGIGAAGYGTGTATFGESSDRLSFAARLDLSGLLSGLNLDLFDLLPEGTELPLVGEDSELVGSPDLTDFFPAVEFKPVVFEQTNPGFTLEASDGNAPLCGGAETSCSGDTVINTSESTTPDKTMGAGTSEHSAEHHSSGFSAHYRSGASVAEAEGEYVIIGAANLDVSKKAAVGLGGGAQSGISVINSVNASATVVGNALNMGRTGQVPTVHAPATQGNLFIQHR